MAITLNPATEQRIQREVELGHYTSADEFVAHALDLLEAEQEWLQISKSALNQRIEEHIAQMDRGEGIAGDQLLQHLAERRKAQ